MKYIELSGHLEQTIKPLYLVTGHDYFLIDKTLFSLKKKCVTDYEELNYNVFTWENFDASAIINSCNGLPFSSERKLVVVKNQNKISKDDEKKILTYAKSPNQSTCLVFVSDEKFFLSLPNVEIVDCSPLSNDQLKMLIASSLKKYGKNITTDAANLLIEKCDRDALKTTNELIKLSFFSDENIITKNDVEFVVANSFEEDIFGLTNALASKNGIIAIKILNSLLLAKCEPSVILANISGNFRRMFLSSISTDMTNEEIASNLGVKPYAITKAKENAKKFTIKNLKKINELLTQTDYMLKNGQMSAVNTIYYLIFNILTL